jgi:DNA-binding XRE family transcriptional regulator
MKKIKTKDGKELIFYTIDEVFKESSKSKVFQAAYKEEMARLKMIKQVRDARLAKKMTQKKLAQKTGMPQSAIARIESGRKGLSLATLSRVAAALGKGVSLV